MENSNAMKPKAAPADTSDAPAVSNATPMSGTSAPGASTAAPSLADPRTVLARMSERQMVLLLVLFGALLYIPFAGSYGLWDPWETHYGEVARQMTERGDFISLWWTGSPLDGEGFWSKPVMSFWLMSLAMHAAGIGERGSPTGEMALSSAPEWAMRVPFCLMALLGIVGVYLAASRFVNRRAGLIAAVALATFPMFGLIARQAMTDMAFVGPMTLALALATFALFDDDTDVELPRKTWKRLSWPHHSLFYVTLGLVVVTVLSQLLVYSLQLEWRIPKTQLVLPGVVAMLPYLAGVVAFVYYAARTRYKAPLYLYIAAILCGFAILAKGLAGLGLPVIVFLAYLLFTWNWKRLQRPQLLYGVLVALLACALVAIPWHHAMLVRHGIPFWNELYGDNHWRRLVMGRHGDRGTFEYFVRQLGYGAFPWSALAAPALAWVSMRRFTAADMDRASAIDCVGPRVDRRREIFWLGAIWFVAAYAVVSLSMTKFHHYILPALPGVALMIACFLDDVLQPGPGRQRLARLAVFIGLPVLALVTFDIANAPKSAQHFIWLFSYDYVNAPEGRSWPGDLNFAPLIITFAALFGSAAILLMWRRMQRIAVMALPAAAIGFTWFLLNVYMPQVSERWSQKPLIAAYYKARRSPDERLIAWQMYWRGENFYTANEIFTGPNDKRTVFLGDRNAEDLKDYLNRNRGTRQFFVVERTRWNTLQGLVPEHARKSLRVVDERNNKFYLAAVDL